MADQRFYDQVAGEIAAQHLDKGLWVRAFSEAQGDEAKAKAAYIGLRVKQLEELQREECERRKAEERAEKAARASSAKHRPAQTRQPVVGLNREALFYLLTLFGGLWILGWAMIYVAKWLF
jgi:hypothetical protein